MPSEEGEDSNEVLLKSEHHSKMKVEQLSENRQKKEGANALRGNFTCKTDTPIFAHLVGRALCATQLLRLSYACITANEHKLCASSLRAFAAL